MLYSLRCYPLGRMNTILSLASPMDDVAGQRSIHGGMTSLDRMFCGSWIISLAAPLGLSVREGWKYIGND